jgi:hypothetical protein
MTEVLFSASRKASVATQRQFVTETAVTPDKSGRLNGSTQHSAEIHLHGPQ